MWREGEERSLFSHIFLLNAPGKERLLPLSAPFWPRAILHVDMDAFYASVEQRDNPELRGKPVIVAGDPKRRGVVSAASYEVRAYGVRSAMPTGKALRLCPHAIRVFPRMERYQEVSETIFRIFARYTPLIQAVSLDEAFLDVTASQRLHGDPVTMAQKIRAAIRTETELTASVGVAASRIVAKIASDLDKPDGLTVIPESEREARLDTLPAARIWGVGPVTNKQLEKLGIRTIGQLRQWPAASLQAILGKSGSELHALANGRDDSEVVPDSTEKSISHETTFAVDVVSMEELETTLRWIADKVATRLRRRRMAGKTIFLKVRYGDFTTVTRRRTLPRATNLSETIFATALTLLRGGTQAGRRPVRLLGAGVASFSGESGQQGELFPSGERDAAKMERFERAADAIRSKLGDRSLRRASQSGWSEDTEEEWGGRGGKTE